MYIDSILPKTAKTVLGHKELLKQDSLQVGDSQPSKGVKRLTKTLSEKNSHIQ